MAHGFLRKIKTDLIKEIYEEKNFIYLSHFSFLGCSDNSVTSSEGSVEIDLNKVYKWNMVTTWPKNYPGLGLAAENLSKYVDEMSNGRLKIKVYGAG